MERTLRKALIFLMFTSTIIAEIHHKRSPHGFQGVRGKREIKTNNLTTNYSATITDEDQISKSIEKSIDSSGIFEQSSPVAIVKRAPVGFMGMRGKKDYEYTDFKNNALFMNDDENHFLGNGDGGDIGFVKYPFDRFVPKRAPSGFMGMRGKKLIDNDFNNDPIKRIPSGFMGMRGKKLNSIFNDEALLNNNHNYNDDLLENHIKMDQKILSDFFKFYGLEQNNNNNNNLNTNLLPNNNDNDNENYQASFTDSYEKRIPSSAGFFGMRGKKLSNDDNSNSDEYEFNTNTNNNDFDKRAPSAGFFGMRGKKWSDEQNFNDNNIDDNNEKRAPSMGFMGMRGKKDVTNVLLNEEKRVPSSGFFGMRGKKVPTGFFGMRGKKGPYEFRGKFVGVRGKKAMNPLRKLAMDLNDLQQQSDLQSSAIFGSPDFQSNKRGKPSGFVGMRGKKWTDSDEQK